MSATGVVRLKDGGHLTYRLYGDPERSTPLVLNRPLGGSMTLWGTFPEMLARALPVIAFDPRGVGRSSDAPFTLSTRSMAADAWALLDELGVPRAHLFGLSLGGMVASWMAVLRPGNGRPSDPGLHPAERRHGLEPRLVGGSRLRSGVRAAGTRRREWHSCTASCPTRSDSRTRREGSRHRGGRSGGPRRRGAT